LIVSTFKNNNKSAPVFVSSEHVEECIRTKEKPIPIRYKHQ